MTTKPATGGSFGHRDTAERTFHPTRLRIASGVWIAPGAVIVGQVTVERNASIWYGCVLRGDIAPVEVGSETNIQDLTLVHVDHGMPAVIGRRVSIGHRCVIHGCTVGDEALIGMGAVLLSGCRVGSGAVVAAGAVVREKFVVPDGSIVAGVPARVVGEVDDRLRERIVDGVDNYLACARGHLDGSLGGGPYGGTPVTQSADERVKKR